MQITLVDIMLLLVLSSPIRFKLKEYYTLELPLVSACTQEKLGKLDSENKVEQNEKTIFGL